ncbi:kelch domain-containing protein 10 homolog [Anopheles aquasalis]|uniref:kelch domain-containing protein 10 homolog n=1 Tax=Anopheles aquasalis TaxID=42839 RepID=UPI00215B05F0|nr:kelch domain-containing protein 10 homolog [Anopheles aquasalis]
MKILLLFIYRVLGRLFDTIQRYSHVPRFIREVLNVEDTLDQTRTREGKMAKRRFVYEFRPFEVVGIDYRNAPGTSEVGPARKYPNARSGHRIVCNDSQIYVFGGFNPNISQQRPGNNEDNGSSCLFQELWKYDTIRNSWTLLLDENNDLPLELASNAMLLCGDTIMIFGGSGFPFGVNCSNKLYVCQPRSRPKEMLEVEVKGDLPPPQYGQGIVYCDNYLYTIGGTNGFDYTLDVHRLHLPSRTWECAYECRPNIREDPEGRYRHELAFDDSRIFVLGGGTSDAAFVLSTVPVYDTRTNQWEYAITKPDPRARVPGIPAPRKCHSCVQIRTDTGVEVIVAGGYDGVTYFRDIWKLNLSTLQWKFMKKSRLPFPLFFHDASITSEGCMYIFGGIKFYNNVNVRTHLLYKMWTKIPSLSSIAWDALLHYIPDIHSRTKEQLLEIGIPRHFVNRVHE